MRKAHGWAVVMLAAAVLAGGCGGDGGDGGDGGGGLDATLGKVSVVAETDAAQQLLDAAPSPDGKAFYFTAVGDAGGAVFRVAGDGGALTTVAEGAPLVRPTGISVAADGVRAFLADGAIYNLPVVTMVGGDPAPGIVPGTEGRSARGLDVVGNDIYFTGRDPGTGQEGLFRVSASGGAVTTVASGGPFVSPDSVVVAADGVAYVTDQGAGPGRGLVFRVAERVVTPLLTDLHLGAPAGVTLIHDEATLLVSSVDGTTRADQVLFLELDSGETATKVIGTSMDSSGGLHRAADSGVLAWADVQRPGRVYRVEL